MKKIIGLALLSVIVNSIYAQTQDSKAEKIGLVSELVYVKLTSENFAIRIVNDTLIEKEDQIRFVNLYNDIKTITDQIIVQLITDCRRKNNLKFFRKLDKLLVEKKITEIIDVDLRNKRLKSYILNLKKMNSIHQKLMEFKISKKPDQSALSVIGLKGFFPSAMSAEEITGALSFVTATIKDIRESKEKKVEKVTDTLNELRLTSLQDLISGESAEEEKEEEQK